jgi:hypothetical protein
VWVHAERKKAENTLRRDEERMEFTKRRAITRAVSGRIFESRVQSQRSGGQK